MVRCLVGRYHLLSLQLTASPLKMDDWKMSFLLGRRPPDRCYVSFGKGSDL